MAEIKDVVEERPHQKPIANEDLSEAIAQTMDRQSDEEVRCVRVFEDRYRCNWWVRGTGADWLAGATRSIRKSTFLRVSRKADKLIIEDLSKPA